MGNYMRLKGKTAIVTGAASGFGAGIARKFSNEGAQVMVADLNFDGAQKLADEIGGVAQLCNVAKADSVKAMRDAGLTKFGHIDILVNNAAIDPKMNHLESNSNSIEKYDTNDLFQELNVACLQKIHQSMLQERLLN